MAYSVSHLQGENPTLATLTKFERDELLKKCKEVIKVSDNFCEKSSPTIYGGYSNKERYPFIFGKSFVFYFIFSI